MSDSGPEGKIWVPLAVGSAGSDARIGPKNCTSHRQHQFALYNQI